jgi:hypothetical protein
MYLGRIVCYEHEERVSTCKNIKDMAVGEGVGREGDI